MSVTIVENIAIPAQDVVTLAFLFAGDAVAAGFPSPAQDYFDGSLDLNNHLIRDKTSTFIVRVSGESMTGAGISDGDELVVDRSLSPKHGNVVIAILDGELTVKRLELTPGGVILRARELRVPADPRPRAQRPPGVGRRHRLPPPPPPCALSGGSAWSTSTRSMSFASDCRPEAARLVRRRPVKQRRLRGRPLRQGEEARRRLLTPRAGLRH